MIALYNEIYPYFSVYTAISDHLPSLAHTRFVLSYLLHI